MSNIQAQELINAIKADQITKANLRDLDDAISRLYVHRVITRAEMVKARDRLIKLIRSREQK